MFPVPIMLPGNVPEIGDDEFIMPSHLPPLQCVSPLPNLSSVVFFSTPRAENRHGWRPQPPTPARGKMLPKGRDAEPLGAKPQRPSVSAIPRPAQKLSTRRSSKSCLTTTDLLLSPEKARRPPQRRSTGIRSENPPSSYHLPRNLLPRSESFLAHFEELGSIENASDISRKGITKSQTTPALLSPNKDITSHRLLRPLDPPLPRSSTYDNFLSPKCDEVPRKDPWGISFSGKITPQGFHKQRHEHRSPYPLQCRTTGLHPDENRTRSPKSGSEGSEVDPRFVNTLVALASFHANNVQVFVSETPTYWLGRYTTIRDRLRTKKLIPGSKLRSGNKTASRMISPKHRNSIEFECAESEIKRETIEMLRSFCQTEAALNSLARFNVYISETNPSSSKQLAKMKHEPVNRSHPPVVRQGSEQYPPINTAKPKIRKLSNSLPHIPSNIFRKDPSLDRRHPTITKSITLGDFGNKESFSNLGSGYTGQEYLTTCRHAGKLAYHANVSEPRLRAIEDDDVRQKSSKTLLRESGHQKVPHVRDIPRIASEGAKIPLSEQVQSIKLYSESREASYNTAKHEVAAVDGRISRLFDNSSTPSSSPQVSPGETLAGTSRRFRKSESMKKLFDASIKEFRKMGHRVNNPGGHGETDEY